LRDTLGTFLNGLGYVNLARNIFLWDGTT
jgi:hypothetical protein